MENNTTLVESLMYVKLSELIGVEVAIKTRKVVYQGFIRAVIPKMDIVSLHSAYVTNDGEYIGIPNFILSKIKSLTVIPTGEVLNLHNSMNSRKRPSHIKELFKAKRNAQRKWMKTGDPADQYQYDSINSRLKAAIQESEKIQTLLKNSSAKAGEDSTNNILRTIIQMEEQHASPVILAAFKKILPRLRKAQKKLHPSVSDILTDDVIKSIMLLEEKYPFPVIIAAAKQALPELQEAQKFLQSKLPTPTCDNSKIDVLKHFIELERKYDLEILLTAFKNSLIALWEAETEVDRQYIIYESIVALSFLGTEV